MKKIYIFSIDELIKEQESFYLSLCDKKRRENTIKYKNEQDRLRSIAAGLLLQFAYKMYLQENGKPDGRLETIDYKKNGKPYVEQESDFCFSISHSKEYVILAVSECEIGADIEQIVEKKDVLKLTNRFFHSKEIEEIISKKTIEEQRKYFTRTWTVKESYIKLSGAGLQYGMNSFFQNRDNRIIDEKKLDFEAFVKTILWNGDYYISICSVNNRIPDKVERISLDGILNILTS